VSCAKRLRLIFQLEWGVALLITAVVIWLDINYARHAGVLWRDEINSLSMATYSSLQTTWERLQFDSFPMLWYLVLREWVKAGMARTDAGFRIFGLLVNVAILGILWLNAWRMSRRPPLVALTLLGANATVMMYCGSVRGYGLGLVCGLWMYGAVWAYLVRPTAVRWAVALLAALLACHTLYYNCVFVGAACLAGTAVALCRRQQRVALWILALGAATALTLLIYVPTFRSSGDWRSMYVYSGGFIWLFFKFAQAVMLAGVVMLPVWMIVPLYGTVGGFITWSRARVAAQNTALDQITLSGQPGLALFSAMSILLGLIGNVLFLRLLSYVMQPWYFLSLMAVLAAGADAVQCAAPSGRGFRVLGVALAAVGLTSILFVPLRLWSVTRRTSVDKIAQVVEQSAGKADYIILTDWNSSISFYRYYRGSTPWQTLPPLPPNARDIHRGDLVFKLMTRGDVLGPVFDSVTQTLHDEHRVFYIGKLPLRWPSEHPRLYFSRRAEEHNPLTPVEDWRYELMETVHGVSVRLLYVRGVAVTEFPLASRYWTDPA